LIAWLQDNLTTDLSIEKLARRAAMSPRNFARLFRQELRKTPAKHIEDLRLEAARRQLESVRGVSKKSRMQAASPVPKFCAAFSDAV
jgi:transcriptional regulator GlxA family with amidase domain